MTAYGQPRVWLDQFPLEEPQPFEHDYHGIRYPGEVIRADTWSPQWGEPLLGDMYFRIVLLSRQTGPTTPRLDDDRIALCLPGAQVYRQRDQLVDELATLRETQALYATQRNPETDLIRRTLQRREEGLEEELITQEATRYSLGTALAGPGRHPLPSDVFTGPDPVSWFSSIAGWLLARAYPNLPVKEDLLPRAVTQDDAGQLYQAIFAESDASSETLALLGPGLGLSPPEHPGMLNTFSCPVLRLIGGWMQLQAENQITAKSWADIHHYLSHQIGLTRHLAALYLLLFLRQERPELEVRLSGEHRLALAGGRPLPGTRLTGDLLGPLVWDPRIADWGITIGPVTQPHWNDALPYLSVLYAGLSPADEETSISQQEQRLRQDLALLGREVAQAREFLAVMERRSGALPDVASRISQALLRLSSVSGDDFRAVYYSVRNSYGDYRLLEEDVALLGRLSDLTHFSEQVQKTWSYLDDAAVPVELAELSIERRGLEAALGPGSLLRFSRSWNVLSRQASDFKARYAAAYRAHHRRINQDLPAYEADLGSGRLKLRALELLNTLSELGGPTGAGLSETLEALDHQLSRCVVPSEKLELDENPLCAACQLTLEQSLPTEALSRHLVAIDAALGQKNRQLSNLLVERILHGQVDQRLEDFLKIVQASDLSALSNTLNEELVAFIRRMLA